MDLTPLLEKFGQRIRDEGLGRPAVCQLTGLGEWRAKRLIELAVGQQTPEQARARMGQHARRTPLPAPAAPPLTPETAERVTTDEQGDTCTVECPKGRISTPEELLARAGIDQRVWKVERVTLNNYEMGSTPRLTGSTTEGWKRETNDVNVTPLFSIKVWLTRRNDVLELDQMREDMLAEIRAASPVPTKAPRRQRGASQLLYMGAHDIHAGKYSAPEETGEVYHVAEATDLAMRSTARLMQEASPHGIERILLPVGHDLTHVDSSANTTTRGTPQDMDGRFRVMRRYAYELMVRMILQALELAPVEVEAVPGNHGRESDLAIAERLEARFWNNPHVTVRASLHPRPYYTYGTNLLGLTHGDGPKAAALPLIMAKEMPQAWAETTHREWLLGHFHKKMTLAMQVIEDEYQAVRVRHLPSISALDYYHVASGYSNVRAMEAYRYDRAEGYSGHHSIPVSALGIR